MPVSVSLELRLKRIGLKNAKDKNDNKKNANTKANLFNVINEIPAVIKAARAKFKKNMLGVKISSITKAIPITHKKCQTNKINLLNIYKFITPSPAFDAIPQGRGPKAGERILTTTLQSKN